MSATETLEKGVKICSKLTIKTPFSNVSIVNFEQVNVSWVILISLYPEGVYLLNISTFTHSSIKLSYFSSFHFHRTL